MFDIKRKNGVFRGFTLDKGGKEQAAKMKAYHSGGPKGEIKSVSVTQKPRKNGVWQGVSITADKKKAQAAAARRSSSTPSNAVDAQRKMDANKKAAASRAAARKSDQTASTMKSRGQRIQAGPGKGFKGKYWGPDVFKGNQAKIDAWKKAGKPRNADGSAKG